MRYVCEASLTAPRIVGIGTAVPVHQLNQDDVRSFAHDMFAQDFTDITRLLPVFTNAGIDTRHFAEPRTWYAEPKEFVEANSASVRHALDIAELSAQRAMQASGCTPQEIGSVVVVSSTGIATPSLDAALIQRLGIAPTVHRVPVWGLGCAGGVSGLGLAGMIAQSMPDKAVLLVAVEMCSLTFQHNDRRKSNLVALSLFADGSASVVVRMSDAEKYPAIRGRFSTLFPATDDIMGWDLADNGLRVRFSRDIPSFITKYLPDVVASARAEFGIAPTDECHIVAHPGGTKVLSAYTAALSASADDIEHSRTIMRTHGNMSSPTVLFVLKHFLEHPATHTHTQALVLALGPGFSAETVLLDMPQ